MPGVYNIKDFPMSSITAAQMMPVGYYNLVIELFDDNNRKKSQLVARFIGENHRV
jgi:hypothetical protein